LTNDEFVIPVTGDSEMSFGEDLEFDDDIALGPLANEATRFDEIDESALTEDQFDSVKAQYNEKEGLYQLFFTRNIDSPFSIYSYAFFLRVKDIRASRSGTKVKGDWMLQNLVGAGSPPTEIRGFDDSWPNATNNYLLPILFRFDPNFHYDENQIPQGMVQLWTSPAFRGTRDNTQHESVVELLVDYNYLAASSDSTLRMRFVERTSEETGWNFSSVKSVDFSGTSNVLMDDIWGIGGSTGIASFPTHKSAFIPMTPEASRYHQFMMYNPGSFSDRTTADAGKSNPEAKLTIHNFHVALRSWSGRRPY
jgi:hypothetical protein